VNGEEEDEDESAVFREAMRGVRPLGTRERRVTPPRRRSKARARFSRAAGAAPLVAAPPVAGPDRNAAGADALEFRRPGLQQAALKKLRRGQVPVQDEIDLHGLTVPQAEAALCSFLGAALARQLRCVRIVHGKGHRSGERGPVLKASVNSILARTPPVLAFVAAGREGGGTGATLVLLKTGRGGG
jgi:DNA-nicking Smr family endonuclease